MCYFLCCYYWSLRAVIYAGVRQEDDMVDVKITAPKNTANKEKRRNSEATCFMGIYLRPRVQH